VRRLGYQALGFTVWRGARLYLRRRYGDRPRKVAAALLLVGALATIVAAQRKAGG
jgi:hypothetical protein